MGLREARQLSCRHKQKTLGGTCGGGRNDRFPPRRRGTPQRPARRAGVSGEKRGAHLTAAGAVKAEAQATRAARRATRVIISGLDVERARINQLKKGNHHHHHHQKGAIGESSSKRRKPRKPFYWVNGESTSARNPKPGNSSAFLQGNDDASYECRRRRGGALSFPEEKPRRRGNSVVFDRGRVRTLPPLHRRRQSLGHCPRLARGCYGVCCCPWCPGVP